MTQIIRIHAFTDNYIWLLTDSNYRFAYVVDPGDAQPVIQTLHRHHIELIGILITHHHFDHTGGIVQLKNEFNCVVYGPDNSDIVGVDHKLAHGDTFELAELGFAFSIIKIPGHTLDHIAYYSKPMLFCGDTLFACGCGRMFEGQPEQFSNSLNTIANLPDDTVIYCAHEYTQSNINFARSVDEQNSILNLRYEMTAKHRKNEIATVPSCLSLERATNPFLRTADSVWIHYAQKQMKANDLSSTQVFAAIRDGKDHF